jgi:hypothetical protein
MLNILQDQPAQILIRFLTAIHEDLISVLEHE